MDTNQMRMEAIDLWKEVYCQKASYEVRSEIVAIMTDAEVEVLWRKLVDMLPDAE